MPRIRTIKPEFWGDEKLAPMAPIDRLVFMGLWSMADDAGRLVDSLRAIDGFIFPESSDSARESLMRLSGKGRILRYTSPSGQPLIQIAHWGKHQYVQHPSPHVLPPPPNGPSGNSHESDVRISRDPPEPLMRSSGSDLGAGAGILDRGSRKTAEADLDPERALSPPAASAPTASEGWLLDELPEPARSAATALLRRCYGGPFVLTSRREDVLRQLVASLSVAGAKFAGQAVRAGTPERLAAKIHATMAESLRNPDRAIVVLLAKLADTSDGSAPGAVAAEAERTEAAEVEHELGDAEQWVQAHDDAQAAVVAQLERIGFARGEAPKSPSALTVYRSMRRSFVLHAYRGREHREVTP